MRNRVVILVIAIILLAATGLGVLFLFQRAGSGSKPGTLKNGGEATGQIVAGVGVSNIVVDIPTSSQEETGYAAPDSNGRTPEIPKELLDRMKYSDSRVSSYVNGASQEGAPSAPSVLSAPVPADPSRDTDGDGLNDAEEIAHRTDAKKKDTDGDGLSDGDEVNRYRTNPRTIDTDGDGLNDAEEVATYKTNPNLKDTDGDGFDDGTEVAKGYDPLGPGKRQ